MDSMISYNWQSQCHGLPSSLTDRSLGKVSMKAMSEVSSCTGMGSSRWRCWMAQCEMSSWNDKDGVDISYQID